MILVDSSVWIDHLRRADLTLSALLDQGLVLAHPFVIGELALGNLGQRSRIIGDMLDLPHATVANDNEVLAFIESQALFGRGIGYIDAHLLASVRLTATATLWTRDKRLLDVAVALGIAETPRSLPT